MKQYILGIEATLEIFGGKWKALIAYILNIWNKKNWRASKINSRYFSKNTH